VATLRDKVRPVVGGLQIRFSNYFCSLGFNATRAGVAGYVTAAHCSTTQGGVDGTQYYQPLNQVTDEFIGTEIADPKFFRNNGCPRGAKCRWSDSNFSDGADNVSFTLGRIAKTTGANNGSLEIAGEFAITAKGTATVGQTANKVGRTTGWTQGTVSRTCANSGVSGTNIILLCQDFVDSTVQIVAGGDSGSNVFRTNPDGSVTLLGVLWGGNTAGTQFVYSPIANVERELGALTTH
jgi:streptogrisin C